MSEPVPLCQLCEAARMTEWFHDDDECWIAECELCAVPMVVWQTHDPSPPDEVRARLVGRLRDVASASYGYECWIDDNMRSIPDHYHAHARPKNGFFGHGLRARYLRGSE